MWQIIKAEYFYTLFAYKWKVLSIIAGIILLPVVFQDKSLVIIYLFLGVIFLSFYDDNRYYIYQTLPVKSKKIAIARLIMLGINLAVLTILVLPFIIYKQTGRINNINQLLILINGVLLMRLLTFSLFDIISDSWAKKKRIKLTLLFSLVISIAIAFSYITIYFKNPELIMYLSFSLIPLFAFISIKTFLAKERVVVREEL
ncbi:MAG: hypothetical protein KKF62_04570 [Bacteroidetes bacterium]|nr:hypothetical protein [Bacteroidota bacterium]MBU1114282.1 hypothetical protein [Bacteroidota bacterium]MBU1798019.1 hypothetical protein [Bacteroidota bacterium]